ncbi:L,D-transpeptidase [uncultured Agitococcus sp.]|uniref:L,D-transpeptidase n=1 Tax=uncultured Agitococcus sp. TaxID=1506599 RepID=UPI00261C304B|nr:L,D-transpeptidase [uncultured Agitococcus sp.]
MNIEINIATQQLTVWQQQQIIAQFIISSALKGVGEIQGSEQTPRGQHIIRAKIGQNQPINSVFKARRPTGEIYNAQLAAQFPTRDWILTRIMWLSGCELGKNRGGQCDTMRRYIYIHGTPDTEPMGIPKSHGCIRMRNEDIIQLFDLVPVYTPVIIHE